MLEFLLRYQQIENRIWCAQNGQFIVLQDINSIAVYMAIVESMNML